jgi:hypothetical protein
MSSRTTGEVRPALIAALAVLALVAGALWWWWSRDRAPAAVEPPASQGSAAVRLPPVASAPAIRYPVEHAEAATAGAEPPDLATALTELFGRDAVLSLFQLDDFARRVVATVDNLGRSQAGARLRPLRPASGRFTVTRSDGGEAIGADNGLRYTPYVLLLENVDLPRAVALYARLYPSFQQAYEELGYPHGYFNDRLVEVIDVLLATPERSAPLRVHLPSMPGQTQPARPWVLYEFDDPQLQSLPAGQKLLLRMGPVNERRIKAKLLELRRLLTARPAPR